MVLCAASSGAARARVGQEHDKNSTSRRNNIRFRSKKLDASPHEPLVRQTTVSGRLDSSAAFPHQSGGSRQCF